AGTVRTPRAGAAAPRVSPPTPVPGSAPPAGSPAQRVGTDARPAQPHSVPAPAVVAIADAAPPAPPPDARPPPGTLRGLLAQGRPAPAGPGRRRGWPGAQAGRRARRNGSVVGCTHSFGDGARRCSVPPSGRHTAHRRRGRPIGRARLGPPPSPRLARDWPPV